MAVNRVILIGNVGQNPEIKSTQDGDKIINLNEYKFHKNTAQRLEKSDFTEKIRLELKEKIKNQKINGASFMIFDDFICSTKQKLEKELKKN